MEWLTNPEVWVALVTLTALEIVLGIDNIVFISIIAGKLPAGQQGKARTLGLTAAMFTRILLLLTIAWIVKLDKNALFGFTLFSHEVAFTGKDLILIAGGLFLVGKSTTEIHHKLEGSDRTEVSARATFAGVIIQIMLLDIVFSLDSVITAVGMVKQVEIMIAAVVIAVGVMLFASGPIGRFVEEHPTVKMLALSFLLMIGVLLIADGFHHHIPKGYVYFAMGFSVFVEMLNLRMRKKMGHLVHLNEPLNPDAAQSAGISNDR